MPDSDDKFSVNHDIHCELMKDLPSLYSLYSSPINRGTVIKGTRS